MTVNEIRQQLGEIVEQVYTKDFTGKFNMIMNQLKPGTELFTVETYSDEIDAFITLASTMIGKKHMLETLSKVANPLVVYGVFYRYHVVTQFLMSSQQSDQRILPLNESSFFKAVLIDLAKELLASARAGQSM